MSAARILGAVALTGGLLFAVFGGEYSTLDWWQMKRRVREERAAIAQLRVETDSLRALADSLETDPGLQERVAREKFGMIRPGEKVYRIVGDRR